MNVRINLSGLKDEETEGDSAGEIGEINGGIGRALPERSRARGEEIIVIAVEREGILWHNVSLR